MRGVKLYQGDCLEIMPTLQAGSMGMVLCDLPYGMTARNAWDVVIPFEPLWAAYTRLTRGGYSSYGLATLCVCLDDE